MKPLLALATAALLFLLPGCATQGGIAAANFLESPTNQRIIEIAAQAGAAALVNSGNNKLSPEMRDALAAAAAPALSVAATGTVWAIGEALRGQQATPEAAKAPALASAISADAGAPASAAKPIALAVRSLSADGIPPDAANEAVAVVVQSVAAQREGLP